MKINKILTLFTCLSILGLSSCSSNDDNSTDLIEIVIDGATVTPNLGGANEPNQVYVDLSTNTTTEIARDSWDLGFSSGTEFRVVLNGSIYMATAALSATDIDAVTEDNTEVLTLQEQVAVGTYAAENIAFVDAPNGDLSGTAIAEVTEDNNNVYLLNLGFGLSNESAATGSVAVTGESRGWKKIKITKSGNDYVLQYADLNATTHQEITISKNSDYNFTFFSFNTETVVDVEPKKSEWDLNFTVFTNEIQGYGSYGYTDFVANNLKADAKAYLINNEEATLTYDTFTLDDVNSTLFENDQRNIGSSWRNGGGPSSLPSLKDSVFYIVQDANGNYYKLKFLALTNESGVRGYPEFVYSLLQ
ncbi:heme-binding protein HmuY-like protein [Formosa agariphila KMM 3901]|uniref:Heme-binding protein HmuY-like protein n=1 Tax=Formosa agariphila (strain DSM 15362 / KCTC 12365 / LMG 23005 / KMM 3901 / M-2Alg 35-1) TaxID=1347342 RepID=T2KSA7_FORAG|nr:HmuY family protein [Formosa agariphila]CDF81089.1 heme-binding protein HmuY-like protein [Formosa agariphila KMM 3901]